MAEEPDWSRVDALLEEALARPASERRRYLDETCGTDTELRLRLEGLLRIAETDDPELRPGGALAGTLAAGVLERLADGQPAALPPGTRLGRFELEQVVGRGATGWVYKAHDTLLGRSVAIKALARSLADEPGALARFQREARALATIKHPNVAAIHGLELLEGAPYLVLELVEGQTLGELLDRGPLPWRRAVEIAAQIAEALEEAHRKGIVHRDLKPANVKLTPGGRVKVLDFGLARSAPPLARPLEPPSIGPATAPGTILGTAPYMSPEQAQGLAVDGRSDIWALGCVVFEMLSARRPFRGDSLADVLAAVMRDEPDWAALPTDTPPRLRRLLEDCLRREPRQRLKDVAALRRALADLSARPPSSRSALGPWRPPPAVWIAWLVALASLGTLVLLTLRPRPATQQGLTLQLGLDTPEGVQLFEDYAAPFALSPDGSTLVFVGTERGFVQLYARRLDSTESKPLPGTTGAGQPLFSPDGRWVAFFASGKLKKVALAGGQPINLVELGMSPRGASWGEDGSIILTPSQTSGLARVAAEGGRLEVLTRPDPRRGERSHRWPQILPGGQAVVFTVDSEGSLFDDAGIEVLSLRTGERRRLLQGGAHARLLGETHLVFGQAGRLYAVRFDPARLEILGRPELVLEGVHYDARNGGTHIALARDGTLVYAPGLPISREHYLAWIDAGGRSARLDGPPRLFHDPRLDPWGERVAVRVGPSNAADLWVQGVLSGTLSQLTFERRVWRPVWTRDGRRIVVAEEEAGRWRLLAVPLAGGEPDVLYEGAERLYPGDFSPDGRWLALQRLDVDHGWNIELLPLDEAGRPQGPTRAFAAGPANEGQPRFSADGRWLCYESDELDGDAAVYVAPFDHAGPRVRASQELGRWPVWGRRGELFYWLSIPKQMRRLAWHEAGDAFMVDADEIVWSKSFRRGYGAHDFDPQRGRLLYLEELQPDAAPPRYGMRLFVGWLQEVNRRLTAARP